MNKIAVAVSGGVDSAVCWWQFLQTESVVTGIYMRNWDVLLNNDRFGHEIFNRCHDEDDYQSARALAKHLKQKLTVVSFIQEYWEQVFQTFLAKYRKGFTPNPDILCNKNIKFTALLNYIQHNQPDIKLATGHYARIHYNSNRHQYELLKAKDQSKDQTYFLSRLTQQQLSAILFPLGELTKTEVRRLATMHNLPPAQRRDSTGICFIGRRNFIPFLQNYIKPDPGDIVDIATNKVIGHHQNIAYYTIGQRHKLKLSGNLDRYYVVGKNPDKKIIYVATSRYNRWLFSDKIMVKQFNWINDPNITNFQCEARFRYRQSLIKVSVVINGDQSVTISYQAQFAVTPGQEAVLYQQELCLGGGSISKVFAHNKVLKYLQF